MSGKANTMNDLMEKPFLATYNTTITGAYEILEYKLIIFSCLVSRIHETVEIVIGHIAKCQLENMAIICVFLYIPIWEWTFENCFCRTLLPVVPVNYCDYTFSLQHLYLRCLKAPKLLG